MEVKNTLLRWLTKEGNMDVIRLWYWLKFRYESASKLDPLRILYREKIWLLKLMAGGSQVDYIDHLQGLEILHRETKNTVEPEDEIVSMMFEQIEDLLLYGP